MDRIDEFLESVHNGKGNKNILWNYNQQIDSPITIFFDFEGRKKLINHIRNYNYNNAFEILFFLPYEVQVPVFYLKNKPFWKRRCGQTILVNKNTCFLFSNSSNICNSYNSILKPLIIYQNNANLIREFAINVMRILKLSTKPLINNIFIHISIEIAGLILTTERLRSEQSLLISYIEFYKLKHSSDQCISNNLKIMFFFFQNGCPTLVFPQSQGASMMINTSHLYIKDQFEKMIEFSPAYKYSNKFPFCWPLLLKYFYKGKFEKLKAISGNRPCMYHSRFKFFVIATKKFVDFKNKFLTKKCFECLKNARNPAKN